MQTLVMALISNSVIAAALCLLAELTWRIRRPALAHAIWVLALVKLITPPIWHVALPASPMIESKPIPIASVPAARETISLARQIALPIAPIILSAPPTAHISISTPSPSKWNASEIALLIWLTGSIAILAVAIVRIRGFNRILKDARPIGPDFNREIRQIASLLNIRRTPQARLVHGDISPMVFFLGRRAVMLLPSGISEFDSEKRAAILAHELAHLRRGDHWVRLLELLATIALWWHPLVWIARHRLRPAEEEACDAWVIWALPQARRSYADVLVEMVGSIWPRVPAASGLGAFGHLKRRLVMILQNNPNRSLGFAGWTLVALLATTIPLGMARAMDTTAPPPANQLGQNPAPDDVTTSAVKGLLDAMVNADPRMQQAANASIFTFGSRAIPVLINGMSDPATSPAARQMLTGFGAKAVDPLIAVLDGKDRAQRLNALSVLDNIATNLTTQFSAAPGFAPPGGFVPPGGFRGTGGGAFAGPPPGANIRIYPPGQLEISTTNPKEYRISAQNVVITRTTDDRTGEVTEQIVPFAPPVDDKTREVLARIDDAAARATGDTDPDIRHQAAALMLRLVPYAKDDSLVPRLMDMLDDQDPKIRLAALKSLGALGSRAAKAVPALTNASTDPQPDIRAAAINALGNIGPDAISAMPTVVQALKDSDPQVRLAAAAALGNMNRGGQ